MNFGMMYRQVKTLVTSHGSTCAYTKVNTGVYDPATGLVTNTETNLSITAFVEGFTASQFRYPSLVGKSASMFYILPDSIGALIPAINDTIASGGNTFTIDSVQSHSAAGQVMLYIVVGYY
jgi:hypothetical protein